MHVRGVLDTGKCVLSATEPRATRSKGLRRALGTTGAGSRWRRLRGPLPVALVGLLTVAAVVVAVLAPGAARKVYALDDGGVWVTNGAELLTGRLNYPSQALDGGVRTGDAGDDIDVLQQGSQVVAVDRTKGTASAIDAAQVATATAATLPSGASVLLGGEQLGGEVGVLDVGSGRVWMTSLPMLGQLQTTAASALKGSGHVVAAAVAVDGTLFTLDRNGRLMRATPGSGLSLIGALPGFSSTADPSMTVVGSTPVVADSSSRSLWLGTTRVEAAQKGALLQAPSAASTDVVYATATSLVAQPLAGGVAKTEVASNDRGDAAAPVVVNGCAYGAWSGSARFLRWCEPESTHPGVVRSAVSGLDSAAVFRVNRSRVVLNDPASGSIWLVDAGMQRITDWSTLKQQLDSEKTTTTTKRTIAQAAVALPDRKGANNPPVAVDDHLGVRAGTTAVLHVLDNDSDPDGDVLTAVPDDQPSLGPVQAVDGGSALQIRVPAGASGSTSFRYSVSDGRGGVAKARVFVTVVPAASDTAPVQRQVPSVSVESGATVTFDGLGSWRDPDGDAMQIVDVKASGSNSVRSTPGGVLTFTAGSATGEQDVTVTVSDGKKSGRGRFAVVVRPKDTASPVANNDRATAAAGETITVSPLANDIDPSASPLRLSSTKTSGTGVVVVPDYDRGTFTFQAARRGAYYVQYAISDGSRSGNGLVRVDVGPATSRQSPIAMQDTAYLPNGGQVTVDPLTNDTDPAGGILVLESISIPDGVQVSAAIVGHGRVRLTDVGGTTKAFEIGYVVANAAGRAKGVIRVVPAAPSQTSLPPVAVDDHAVVRAGDMVSVDVLDNDISPSGAKLYVIPQLVSVSPTSSGRAFVSGDLVRFVSNGRAGAVRLTYSVTDAEPATGEAGATDAATITIQVQPKGGDQPPRPQPLIGRVLQGGTVQIPVPVDGIDPDGDSVQLISVGGAQRGVAKLSGSGIAYTAGSDQIGTDEFSYTVQDRLGLTASATVRIGIAAAATQNQPPHPVTDTVRARPGRQVSVDVMANDSDPDGDVIRLVSASGAADAAEVAGERVLIRIPARTGTTAVSYKIADSHGLEATGSLSVISDPEAPLLAPTARDDEVTPPQIADRTTVTVPVLKNDDDPDGVAAQLIPSVLSGAAIVRGKQLVVTARRSPQIVVYSVRDIDGLKATAVVRVPGLRDLPPVLRSGVAPAQVTAGHTVRIPLERFIIAPSGKKVIVTQANHVTAPGATISVSSDRTELVYTAGAGEYGKHVVNVEVTDGTGPADPRGRKATLSIEVDVASAGNVPPRFVGGTLLVAKGETARFDLRAASSDANAGGVSRLRYVVARQATGFSATVDGGVLRVSAAAAVGSTGDVTITALDGKLTTTGTITVRATGTTRKSPIANPDTADAKPGQVVSVPVLRNDIDPFPDEPLRIVSVSVATAGAGKAAIAGDQVRVTPAAGFKGTLKASYTVADASGDPSRNVTGSITVRFQAAPDAPGIPTGQAVDSRSISLSWPAAVANGARVTEYLITGGPGGTVHSTSTAQIISGLTTGTAYRFRVTAVSEVGNSNPSAPSAPITPNLKPGAPVLTSVDYGDGALVVNWADGTNLGSAITSYRISVPDAGASSPYTVLAGKHSFTVAGLANGHQYGVSMVAVNSVDASDQSNTLYQTPATTPGPVAAPTVTSAGATGSQTQATVSWNPPNAVNAEALTGYRVQITLNGRSTFKDVAADDTSLNYPLQTAQSDYQISIAAKNKATDSGRSPLAYGPATTYQAKGDPGQPTTPTATAGDGAISLAWGEGDLNGVREADVSYQYDLNKDGSWRTIGNVSGQSSFSAKVTSGISNGTTYTVRVRAVGQGQTGAPSDASNAVVPYGKPNAPVVAAKGNSTTVTVSWSPGASNGLAIRTIMVSTDGGATYSSEGAGSGSKDVGNGHSQTATIEAYAIDTAGQTSAHASASATSDPPPSGQASHGAPVAPGGSFGSGHQSCATNNNNCALVRVTYQNVPAGTYHWQCIDDQGRAAGTFGVYASDTESAYHSISISGSGYIDPGCGYGYTGYHLYVRVYNDAGSVDFQTPVITW